MAWIGIGDRTGGQFDAKGIGPAGARPRARPPELSPDLVLPQGSLMIETGLSPYRHPQMLLSFRDGRPFGLQITLQALPGGGVTLVVEQGGDVQHCTVGHTETGRTDTMRLTYCWDAPARRGLIAVERVGSHAVTLFPLKAPQPVSVRGLRGLCLAEGSLNLADDVAFFAVADHIERFGPSPTLTPETPVATPQGYRPVGTLQRGDTVMTANHQIVPVLHRVDRIMPARGSWRPIRLRAPYFGLQQDITVAPQQRLVIRGSEVEYLFGHEAVLVSAQHLAGASAASPAARNGTVTYSQVLLPGHEVLLAAGTAAESLYIGRIRRKPRLLAASLLADLDQVFLPDHGKSIFPVLRAYDAQVLADYRAA